MPKCRQYSVPYNGYDPVKFLEYIQKRIKYVDHVFCELPMNSSMVVSHTAYDFTGSNNELKDMVGPVDKRRFYLSNCLRFLELSKGIVKRICPVNKSYYAFADKDSMVQYCIAVVNNVVKLGVEGLILSDFRLAKIIREMLPDIEIHTSCNCYSWNIRQMQMWRDIIGVKTFNPPREILRSPSLLKEMKQAGFRLKCIINEGCLVGCPVCIVHGVSVSVNAFFDFSAGCPKCGIGDIFRGDWILPRWQKYYDQYVDIYKISGRNANFNDYPLRTLDAYIEENNSMSLFDLMISGTISHGNNFLPASIRKKITLDVVPDKLMTCGCTDCQNCHLCEKILRKYIPSEYNKVFNKDYIYLNIDK